MTDPQPANLVTKPVGEPTPPASARALREYQLRNRRAMRWYALILTAVVVVGIVAVRIAYAHGELTKVSSRTGTAPPPIPAAQTSSELSLTWQSSDHPAGGTAYQDGVVVTYAGHTVSGRDARTGAVRWHYTRSDEVVCAVVQQDSSTIAMFERDGNCDEVTGFVTATGEPKWYRTLVDDGTLSVSSSPNVVMAVSSSAVHVFDNASGLDRWRWTAPSACTVDRALAGSRGVLISYACGSDHHLTLHDLTNDSEKWSVLVNEPFRPVAAGAAFVAVSASSGRAITLTEDKGAQRPAAVPVPASALAAAAAALPRSQATVEGVDSTSRIVELVSLGNIVCLNGNGSVVWSAPSSSPPSLIGGDLVAARDGAAVRLLRVADGANSRAVTLRTEPADPAASATAVGSGLLFTGTDTEYFG